MSHVTGKTQYVDDIRFPGHAPPQDGAQPAAPRPHPRHRLLRGGEGARVRARRFTYKDVPKNLYTILCLIGVGPDEEPVLAEEEVLFKGEQIAAIVAETEEAAQRGGRPGPAGPGRAARRLRRGRGAEAGRADPQAVGQELLRVRGASLPPHPFRRRREGLCRGRRLHRRRLLRAEADRARAAGDHGLRREARGGRPHHGVHQHAGALLLHGQHRADPAGAVQQAALRGRHGGRRVRRQGGRHRRADRRAGGA